MKTLFGILLISIIAQARPDNVLPAETLKQLQWDSVVKTEAFTTPLENDRLKDSAGNVLRLTQEKMSESIARKLLKNKLIQLKLLFAPRAAAYPGMLTKDQSCKDTAVFSKGQQTTSDSLYWFSEMRAADDFSYGACGSRAEPYWSQYLLIYCKKTGILYDLRYFKMAAKKDEEDMIRRPIAKCRP